MKTDHAHLLILAICTFFFQPDRCPAAEETMTWLEADAPPFFIHQGKYQGAGYMDVVGAILKEHLPQYSHSSVVANVARHHQEFKEGKNVCTSGFYKTPEREKFLYFSLPSYFTLPPVLVIRKEILEQIGGKRTVSLNRFLQSNTWVLGLAKDRSYGSDIDSIIQQDGNSRNTTHIASLSLSSNLFEMLKHKRIDAMIALPEEAMYYAEMLDMRDQVTTLTIEENQKDFSSWLSYAACSRTEWGKRAIDRINQVLREQRPSERYRAAYERWLDPETADQYRTLYEKHFLSVSH